MALHPTYLELLFANAPGRFLSHSKAADPNEHQLWPEALEQVGKNCLDGPRRYNNKGELLAGDKPVVANPDSRCGAQQGEELRAVDCLKRCSTNDHFFSYPDKCTILGSHS